MLWRGTEARLLTVQRKRLRWGRCGGKVNELMQGLVWVGVWAEMEMRREAGGSAGEYEEWLA
jgi:hypothetical protein